MFGAPMIDFIEKTLKDAGKLALSFTHNVKGIQKQDRSLVSEADLEVERFIISRLKTSFPNDNVIGEELGSGESQPQMQPRLWAVDPIDGTNPFLNGLPTWGVSIGVMENGKPIAGGFHMPVVDEMFLALAGEGATRNGKTLPNLKDMEITNQTVMLGPSSRKRFYKLDYPGKSVAYGSASAHVAYAATRGVIAALVDRPQIWDILGPLAVLQEVGGGAYHPDGHSLDLLKLTNGEKAEGPVFFGLKENTEKIFPLIEVYPRPKP